MTIKSEKRIYFFGDGKADGDDSKEMVNLLGNKGAQLQGMTKMGLPVPPGFTITTEVGEKYFEPNRQLPDGLMEDVGNNMSRLEEPGKMLVEYASNLTASFQKVVKMSTNGG